MKEHIYGTSLASLNGEHKNGMVELSTEFVDENPDVLSFPIEAVPKLIKFLETLIK